MDSAARTFERLKARYFLVALIIASYVPPGLDAFLPDGALVSWYWLDVIIYYYGHAILGIFLIAAFHWAKPDLGAFFGRRPVLRDLGTLLKVDLFLYLTAAAVTALVFVPVSFLLPQFVSWWLEWTTFPVVYVTMDGRIPLYANLLNFVSIVALAPFLEEVLFRGYLLHRWSVKWGIWKATLLSSALFGLIHPDPLSAAIFGAAMAVLYLRTQSLFVPILAHACYNLAIWLVHLHGVLGEGLAYYDHGLERFQSDWWFGLLAGVLVLLTVDFHLHRPKLDVPLRLPVV